MVSHMSFTLVGMKLGMTRVFLEGGASVPVTVIQMDPNVVTQVRTAEVDGYTAVQVGGVDAKIRTTPIPMIGHDAKAGTSPKRKHLEFRVDAKDLGEYELGGTLGVDRFADVKYVDVVATSKGKGFQGAMKRHNFCGLEASHGVERKHRSPGSIAGHATNRGWSGKIKKGKLMAGRMGNERVTMRSLDVVRVLPEQNILLVKGPVPGPNKGLVEVRPAVRLNRSKNKKMKS